MRFILLCLSVSISINPSLFYHSIWNDSAICTRRFLVVMFTAEAPFFSRSRASDAIGTFRRSSDCTSCRFCLLKLTFLPLAHPATEYIGTCIFCVWIVQLEENNAPTLAFSHKRDIRVNWTCLVSTMEDRASLRTLKFFPAAWTTGLQMTEKFTKCSAFAVCTRSSGPLSVMTLGQLLPLLRLFSFRFSASAMEALPY